MTFDYYLWIILLGYFLTRTLYLISIDSNYTKTRKKDGGEPISILEHSIYDKHQTHNITLASFTIAVFALIVTFPKNEEVEKYTLTLFYFSISMICFFLSSYFYRIRTNRWFPYTAETMEITGILSIGMAFMLFILNLKSNQGLIIVFVLLIVGVISISLIDLYLNKRSITSNKS